MKNYFKLLLFFVFATMMLAQCDCKRTCSNPVMQFNFVGFDSSELRVVVAREYFSNGSFDHLVATRAWSNVNIPGDTVQIVDNKVYPEGGLSDYIIEIPAVNRTWTVKHIQMHYQKSGSQYCTGGMTCYVNDSLQTVLPTMAQSNAPGYINIAK